MTLSSSTTIRVRYAETDQMGIVYHANYLIWFEVGRNELFRTLNLPYKIFEEQGLGLAVVEANCRYRKPAKYDDQITIETTVSEISSRKIEFSYKLLKDNVILAEGLTVHMFINRDGRAVDARNYSIWNEVQKII